MKREKTWKILTVLTVIVASHCILAASDELENCRRHATPQGWSDDIDASLAKAKNTGKELFVYFPMFYDQVSINGKKFSTLRAWTNPEVTAKLAESYVLVFWPWDYGKLLVRPNYKAVNPKYKPIDALSKSWRKVHDYTRGTTPSMLIITADARLVWMGHSTDMMQECEGEGLAFATKRLPDLQKVLKNYYPVRRKIEALNDEKQAATLLFDVLKACDYSFVRTYFREDIERMVKADRSGVLGIREKYPFCWLIGPLIKLRTDFWNAREDKIRAIQKNNRKMSRKEARLKATLAMRDEWEPKFKKLLIAAEKIMPRLFDDVDRNYLTWLKQEAGDHIKIWAGESKEVPFF